MDSVLSGSKTEISKLLEHPGCLKAKNFLGQTVLHLAVLRPEVLSLLLKAHSNFGITDFNVPDISGNSPLHYAAAYGCTESLIALLKAGADPMEEGHLEFILSALFWNHWDVAAEALTFLRATPRTSDAFIQFEMHYLMARLLDYSNGQWLERFYWRRSSELLEKIFNLGVNKHMLSGDGKTLLHYAPDSEWIDHLFDSGFQHVDHSDSKGDTALITFIPDCSGRVWNILARGCNINHRNNRGETALQKVCAEAYFCWHTGFIHKDEVTVQPAVLATISRDLAVIAELLHQGADTSIHDNCRCPCAPSGCSAFLAMLRPYQYPRLGYIWILECLLMLNEIQGQTAAQKLLFEINRLREFEMADMTHVCCRREFARARKPMDDAEVDEIVDEENEFVKNLEDTMRNRSFNPDNESVEGTWLSLIGDFWTPLKGPRLWASWDPTTGQLNGQAPLNPNLFIHSDTTAGMRFYIEEEEDQFLFSPKGFPAPESSIYAAWVEWAYQNSDRYDYPLSVDKNWYEKRKYWAARQAEVLKGLS
jgi:ankyrin repeat protein